MTHWLFLAVAILAEVIATSALKASDGFTRMWPTCIVVAGYGTAFYFMSRAIQVIPVGITYAIWSGVGIVLIALASWILYDQKLDAPALAGIALIMAGVLVINLFSTTGGH